MQDTTQLHIVVTKDFRDWLCETAKKERRSIQAQLLAFAEAGAEEYKKGIRVVKK